MSASDWGLTFETHTTDRWNLEDVARDGDDHALVDAIATRVIEPRATGAGLHPRLYYSGRVNPGDRIACKVCRRRIADGDTTRYGRWFIPKAEFEQVDAFALGVYHEEGGIIGDAVTILPTDVVADVVGAFSESSHADYQAVTRPAWSRVFDPEVVYRA